MVITVMHALHQSVIKKTHILDIQLIKPRKLYTAIQNLISIR